MSGMKKAKVRGHETVRALGQDVDKPSRRMLARLGTRRRLREEPALVAPCLELSKPTSGFRAMLS